MSELDKIKELKASWENLCQRDLLQEWKDSGAKDFDNSDLAKAQKIREDAITLWAELTSTLMGWTISKSLINSTPRQEIINRLYRSIELPEGGVSVVYMPTALVHQLYQSLQALDMGETKLLLCAEKADGKHSPYTMQQENEYISYRFSYLLGAGKTKTTTEQEIASEGVIAFISSDAVHKRIKRENLQISLLSFCYGAIENHIPRGKAFISAKKHMKWLRENTFNHVWKLVLDKV